MPWDRRRVGAATSDAVVFLSFFLVPLVASTAWIDQFTSVKWFLLEALAVAFFLVERLLCGSAGWPDLVRRPVPAWALLGVGVLAGSLGRGLGWAVAPLLARSCFLVLALASFWYFRRNGLRLRALRLGTAAAATVVIAVGLAQAGGANPIPWLTGGDQHSATFGNVNMAAQFLGLALVVVLSWRGAAGGAGLDLLTAGGLAYLHLLGTRSVALGLAAALVFLFRASRLPWQPLVRSAALAALLVVAVRSLGGGPAGFLDPGERGPKRDSALLRLAVWADTLALIRDHPLGVGAGNFEQAFIPYAARSGSLADESVVFRSPHNDYLRLTAEEGIVSTVLLAGLLIFFWARLRASPAIDSWRSPPGALLGAFSAFLAAEAFFQFPFEMAFPALMAAVMLGLVWACAERPPVSPATSPGGSRTAGTGLSLVVAGGLLWGLGRVAAAEYLAVNAKEDRGAQERACRLDPRRLEACVNAAWLRLRSDPPAAATALAAVLERAPHYFPAIKLLGEIALSRGDRETGCRCLGVYDAMFRGRSSAHERFDRECAERPGESGRPTASKPPCPR